MAKIGDSGTRSGMAAGVLLAGAVSLLALPSAVLAFSSRFEPRMSAASTGESLNTVPVSKPSVQLASGLTLRSLGGQKMFRFTPAGTANRPDRSVTVAVRVDPQTAVTISVRGSMRSLASAAPGTVPVQISPTAFNLGVSRGYHSFAQNLVPPSEIHKTDMPDLGNFKLAPGSADDAPARFSPRIVLDQKQATGRAPRTFSGSEDSVDVGGSYSLTRNLDVTAGVRYSQERDRLRPLTDRKQDGQAVYLGTQFRF